MGQSKETSPFHFQSPSKFLRRAGPREHPTSPLRWFTTDSPASTFLSTYALSGIHLVHRNRLLGTDPVTSVVTRDRSGRRPTSHTSHSVSLRDTHGRSKVSARLIKNVRTSPPMAPGHAFVCTPTTLFPSLGRLLAHMLLSTLGLQCSIAMP